MADPLEGLRQEINEDRAMRVLVFADRGRGCPVKRGDIFKLRSCHIEITRTRRERRESKFVWLADFARSYSDRGLHLLARGAGEGHGYTRNPELAISAQDDPNASTIASTDPLENPLNLYPPPEPEAVPSREVDELPTSVAARARYERERAAERGAYLAMDPSDRLDALREQAGRRGPDAESWRQARRARGQARRRANADVGDGDGARGRQGADAARPPG